ncbi:MAG: response regulator, partial [Novosphingobium sp.]
MNDQSPGQARRVALVEDDADLRISTAQVLTLAGFVVESFASAAPALDAIDAEWPGIVVSDVRMPHMSGTELFRALHERDPDLPVILVTGHGDVAMAVDALKAGAWDFLTKPFDPQALVAAADRAATARALALD